MNLTIYLELGFQLDCHYLPAEPQTRDDPGCSDSIEINSIEALVWETSKLVDGKRTLVRHTIPLSPELSEALLRAISCSALEQALSEEALQQYRDFC